MWGRTSLADDLPRLNSYAEALKRYENTIPLRRGEDAGLVPLGDNRRYKRSQMLKAETKRGNAIICRYWSHDVITFYEDGRVHFDIGQWHSPTTMMFLCDVFGSKFRRHKGKIYYIYDYHYYYINPVEGLWLTPNGAPHEPLPEYAYDLDRAKWDAIRKRVKPFTDYAMDMVKFMEPRSGNELVEDFKALLQQYGEEYWKGLVPKLGQANARLPYLSITPREIRYNRGNIEDTRAEFMRRVMTACDANDLDAMYPLMFVLQACASEQRWTPNGYVSECNPERMKKYFYELMKFEYCKEIFIETVQQMGELVTDRNARYFTKPR